MHGSLYLILLVFVIAGAVELYYRWRNPHPISTIAIAPCPICGANADLDGVGQDTFVRCLSHNCAMQGPYGKDEIAAVKAWNAIPSMTTVVAWQFQAAGAALENQKLRERVEAWEWLDEVETLYGNLGWSFDRKQCAIDELYATLVAASAALKPEGEVAGLGG